MSPRWKWTSSPPEDRADKRIIAALGQREGEWDLAEPPSVTRTQLQRLIEEGKVLIEGKPARAGTKLQPGHRVELDVPPPRSMEITPENRPLEILYQDEHLLVINKPPGLTVHPSPTQMEGTLVHALLHHVRDLSGIGGVLRPGIVHRLDKDTSGALVITKTDAAHTALAETFARHEIERRYWALCYGALKSAPGVPELKIESKLGRNPNDRQRMALNVPDGRQAVTFVRELERYPTRGAAPYASWVEARLETGRTHQVRVHLTSLGCSLLGDPVYGTPTERQGKWLALPAAVRQAVAQLEGQALHARVLGFRHPITGTDLRFEAEAPAAFHNALAALRGAPS